MKFVLHHKAIVLLSICFFIAIIIWSLIVILPPLNSLKLLPEIDLSTVDKRLSQKLTTLYRKLEEEPGAAKLWGDLAMILDVHDFKLEAIPCYQQASRLDAKEFRWPYYCAITLEEFGDPGCFEWFERSMSLKSDYPPLLVRYGEALYNAGDLERAREFYQRGISVNENLPHAYLGLAKISLAKGELRNCKLKIEKVLKIAPNYREAHGVLAEVLRRQGHLEDAAKQLEIAQELPKITYLEDPIYDELIEQGLTPFWYGERARRLKKQGHLNEAIPEIETALRLSPNPKGYNYLGTLLEEVKSFEEAARNYRKAITLNPNYYEANLNLARLSLKMNLIDDALFWAEKAVRLAPLDPQAYVTLGTIHERANRDALAIKTYRIGIANTQGSLTLLRRLAWILATSSQNKLRAGGEAVELAEKACQKSTTEDAILLDVLAAAYAETGQFQKATATAVKANRLALANNEPELASQIENRILLYQASRPYYQKKVDRE